MLKNQNTINEVLQWTGAVFIIAGHTFNALGNMDPWNILAFLLGTIAFITWTVRTRNRPQFVVNAVAISTCFLGLFRAWA